MRQNVPQKHHGFVLKTQKAAVTWFLEIRVRVCGAPTGTDTDLLVCLLVFFFCFFF